ncbi:copper homeostasis protein CutC [Arthrobacter sp. E3]|uniref:copper homeostasis protein CutC n=1 Tax=Arthrobacter sp. E3 TaxID=517402 RepID=UPI001A940C79|nr:copper homeostasis protein CutC [Arthrobacter sp. E3]
MNIQSVDGGRRPVLEIAVQDPDGAAAAMAAGADRLELCTGLSTGGLTPSIGLVEAVVAAAGPGRVHVLVRPREGGFVYTPAEVDVMVRDVQALAAKQGVGGVVIGALVDGGALDVDATTRLVAAAGELEVTFHRAIDVCPNPVEVLDGLIELGVTRVLTSGGAARSIEGIDTIASLAARAGDSLVIQAGGGVRPQDIPTLVSAGAKAVHLSARRAENLAGPSGHGGGAQSYSVTDPDIVSAAVAVLTSL